MKGKETMKRISEYLAVALSVLGLVLVCVHSGTVSAAGEIDGKEIVTQAKAIGLDTSRTARANGEGISGSFTPSKLSAAEMNDKNKGFYVGLLELQLKGADYGVLKTGRYNLFLKEDGGGPKMFFESNGQIRARLEVSETRPEDLAGSDAGSGELAFPLPKELKSGAEELVFSHASSVFRRCKIYIKVGRWWVWSGATKQCPTAS